MAEQNPENGRIPGAPSRTLSHKTELMLFLERFDHARQCQWQKLLGSQAEQLRLLTSLIKTKHPANGRLAEPRTQ